MIKNIFIPERIGSYYLFTKRTAGIEISTNHIYASVVLATGNSRTIEKLIDEPLPISSTQSHDERIVAGLKSLAPKLGALDELCCVLPSSLSILKELSLPFLGLKKIKTVVPFEVESLLPFSLDQATIDCIVTHENTMPPQADLLVAAVKNEEIDRYTGYFQAAALRLDKLSIDMFELTGLYFLVAPEHDHTKTIALIDFGPQVTRFALLVNGQLKYIRSIAKPISDELISEISLTINSYLQKLKPTESLSKVVIANSQELSTAALEQQLQVPIHILQPKHLIHNGLIQSKVTTLPQEFLVSLGAGLSTPLTQDFNLAQQVAEAKEDKRINRQLAALAALILLIFFTFSLYSFFRVRTLRIAYRAAEQEALDELKKNFKLKSAQSTTLEAANKAAANELKRQETAWRHLSPENRYAFLRYLTELSRCINVKEAQLELASLSIKEDTIKLYGSVPGYQQLTKLQNQLTCPLFKKVTKLQDLNFKSDPITLTINREEL